ncbi:CHAT domain-containing protein [Oscillochloris sp. ZM17-4]|uniref:CHAT domain-containing protein n=1 Tax=Oscillochloris sp. ZM17-4 TaxID=2866714 RepID=UPI001C73AD82|nr:CHAT domain-containing protein [Oscillochloris sp. ZM17-4]MBX0328277.1 CHAT domain-containing protein [Oscillochloris sp. ZM17-4]
MESRFADLEIGLSRRDDGSYAVDLRYSPPDSAADIRLAGSEPALATFDLSALRALAPDSAAYGQALGAALFASPALRQAFAQARASAASLDVALRLRLLLGPGAGELHALRWETLRDPEAGQPLLTDERLLFSRYLAAGDWRPLRLRPQGELRALVAVAAPSDLARFGLAPIDAAAELARARAALGSTPLTTLADPGQASLGAIIDGLRDGADILYLVCHGAMARGAPTLWLEGDAGATAHTSGAELAQRIRELEQRPRLVLLASCESAGDGAGDALSALGPLLAEAGVPAVIAMQGKVTMETLAAFTPAFFRELARDGQIDRAMAVARGAVRARPDSWMPTLFMRLRAGRIWYVPGFADEKQGFERWPAIVRSVSRGQATPVIGATLSERTLGSPSALAMRWAERYRFPLAPHERDELQEVAQYLMVNQAPSFPREEIADEIRDALARRFAADLAEGAEQADVYDLLAAVGEIQRERDPHDPYKVLAAQPFPIYVTTGYHSLLSEALRAAGKEPMVEFCRWTPDLEKISSIYDEEPRYLPTPARPLVFHLFGILAEPDSLVLAEDDYFDFLMRVARVPDLIPLAVREALADTALLLLGYRIDGWDFRVLYRSLLQQEGRSRRSKYANIAGQVAPDEDDFLLPERARRYFERYFDASDISIFWGSVEDFTRELLAQLAAAPAAPPAERAAVRRR